MLNNLLTRFLKKREKSLKYFEGEIVHINPKGYGFIAVNEKQIKDVYFHISDLPSSKYFKRGTKLSFDILQLTS